MPSIDLTCPVDGASSADQMCCAEWPRGGQVHKEVLSWTRVRLESLFKKLPERAATFKTVRPFCTS